MVEHQLVYDRKVSIVYCALTIQVTSIAPAVHFYMILLASHDTHEVYSRTLVIKAEIIAVTQEASLSLNASPPIQHTHFES